MKIETLLEIVAVLLVLILVEIGSIRRRLKERFPTEKEQDYRWAQEDPMGHSEAHKDDKQ